MGFGVWGVGAGDDVEGPAVKLEKGCGHDSDYGLGMMGRREMRENRENRETDCGSSTVGGRFRAQV